MEEEKVIVTGLARGAENNEIPRVLCKSACLCSKPHAISRMWILGEKKFAFRAAASPGTLSDNLHALCTTVYFALHSLLALLRR